MNDAPGCVGAIVAGGRAARMGGRAKGLEAVGGRRIVDRVAGALAQVTDRLLLVANAPDAAAWLPGVETVRDLVADAGPLGGVLTALEHAAGPVLVVAWDMPFVPASLLGELRRVAETEGADAVVPERDAGGRVEPLCAWYGPACVPAIERRLEADDRRVIGFFDDVRVARLPHDEVVAHGDPARIFLNVNTADELALAEAHATANGGHRRPQE